VQLVETIHLYGKKAAGRVALVDDADYDLVMQYRWFLFEAIKPGRRTDGPYAVAEIEHSVKRMHTLLTGWPRTDHKDHDGLNNQRHNLRPATNSQNMGNRRPNLGASSKYKGVCWIKKTAQWRAMIQRDGRPVFLGLFRSEVEAALAYDAAARDVFGEYACLNFPDVA